MKNQFRIKKIPFSASAQEAASKENVNDAIILGVNESLLLRLNPNSLSKLGEREYILLDSTITSPRTTLETPTKNYVDNNFSDPSLIKNTTHVDFNDEILDNVRFNNVNSFPAIPEHLTAKSYNNQAISYSVDEPSLLRLDPDEQLKLDEQDSIVLNSSLTSPKTTTY